MTARVFNTLYRDFATDGVSASGPHKPVPQDIRDTLNALLGSTSLTAANVLQHIGGSNLTAFRALAGSANRVPYFTGSGAMALKPIGTSGDVLVTANSAITWGDHQTYAGNIYVRKPGIVDLIIDSTTSSLARIAFQKNGLWRWFITCETSGETGFNAGSNWQLTGRADDGGGAGLSAITVMRATGDTGFGVTAPTTKLHVAGPIRCASYTVATVPNAAAVGAGTSIYVSDESGGAVMAFSDGTNWRRVTDRAVIS